MLELFANNAKLESSNVKCSIHLYTRVDQFHYLSWRAKLPKSKSNKRLLLYTYFKRKQNMSWFCTQKVRGGFSLHSLMICSHHSFV